MRRRKREGNRQKTTNLLIPKLYQTRLILHNLIPLRLTTLKQLRQSEPLPRHLVPIIRIHELIVIHAIGRISPHLLHGRLAAVEIEYVVHEGLALFRERERLGGVRGVVFGGVGLAGLVVLARGGGGEGGGFHFAV